MTRPDFLFEVCFEACNKVGGIHTVVSSKARHMTEEFQNFFVIGPYLEGISEKEFIEDDVPDNLEKVFNELSEEGIYFKFGHWDIEGSPKTILIDTRGFSHVADHLKKLYWEEFSVDSLGSGWDFDEPMLWSTAAGKFIERFQEKNKGKRIVGHFHEWISGFGILLLKHSQSPVKTVFTTHATMLGRSISGSGEDLYGIIDDINPEEEAKRHGVMNKFSTERACAHNSDKFTTVSEITGMEAEKILGRKPDPLVFNGLDLREFPDDKELEEKRNKSREELLKIAECMTGEKLIERKDDIEIFFTSGRYEFKNKGMDVFIDSIRDMEKDMRDNQDVRKAIAFFFVPNGWKGMNEELKENIGRHDEDRESFLAEGKKNIISSHDLENENDEMLKALQDSGLTREDSMIRCLIIPIYLSEGDGLFNMGYYDITSGCDLGVFASYYEPWGYTPPESLAVGVPTVTSDLAGYGRFIKGSETENRDVFILERMQKRREEITESLKIFLWKAFDDERTITERIRSCRSTAEKTEWNRFLEKYLKSYERALENKD